MRRRRGPRSLRDIERMTRTPPLAERVAPLPASSLHQIERGARMPNVEQIRSLSYVYNVPVQDLYALMDLEMEETGATESEEDFLTLREKAAAYRRTDQPGRYLACLLRCEEQAENVPALVWVRRARAQALQERGQGAEAVAILLELLSREGVPREEVAGIWMEAAELLHQQQNLEVAVAAGRRGLERCMDEDTLTRARLQAVLGRVLRDHARKRGDTRRAREAVRLLEKSVDGFRDQGLADERARAEVDLGLAHMVEGSRVIAFEVLRRGLALCHKVGNRAFLAFGHKALGEAHLHCKQEREAREHLLRCESLAAAAGCADLQFQALVLLCFVERAQGRSDKAVRRRALALLPWLRTPSREREAFDRLLRREDESPGRPPRLTIRKRRGRAQACTA